MRSSLKASRPPVRRGNCRLNANRRATDCLVRHEREITEWSAFTPSATAPKTSKAISQSSLTADVLVRIANDRPRRKACSWDLRRWLEVVVWQFKTVWLQLLQE